VIRLAPKRPLYCSLICMILTDFGKGILRSKFLIFNLGIVEVLLRV
jgi:hypothetical protein